MKIAYTFNLRLSNAEDEAEFDAPETVDAVAAALAGGGHLVERIDAACPVAELCARLAACAPDLVFNTAEGRRGPAREAFFPALFDELGLPYTGSDAHVLTLTLDKWLTKMVLASVGIDTPRARFVKPEDLRRNGEAAAMGLAFPVIVKPNFEGSSKGIAEDAVATHPSALGGLLAQALRAYPSGVLVEEFVAGTDVTVPYVEGTRDGVLEPVEVIIAPEDQGRMNLFDFRLKNQEPGRVQFRCPSDLPRDVVARLKAVTRLAVRTLRLRDVARVDFRVAEDGRLHLLEANALPSLARDGSLLAAAAREGLTFDETIAEVVASAARRQGLPVPVPEKARRKTERLRVGFTFNVKRVDSKGGNDTEAEYDAPETIGAIRDAIESHGHEVVLLEATGELPRVLADADVDLVFNIAEGVTGRNREAAVPALCELMNIPYTGSDAATLSIALDKALSKRVLKQHGIKTAEFQVMETGREKLSPLLRYPLIVKPNQEGSSKGVSAVGSVVDSEPSLRAAVRDLIDRYRQPALIEDYISGREFTVGLLQTEKRLRVLPPMEIVFKDKSNARPVYDFQIKQDWEKHVAYECPAKLAPQDLRAIERVVRDTFEALDCRDVARVDLRMTAAGEPYVIEINPLPGLTPGYSDLCLIATAAGIEYRALIGEILAGGLRRLRQKRRAARTREGQSKDPDKDARGSEPSSAAQARGLELVAGRNGGTPAPVVVRPIASPLAPAGAVVHQPGQQPGQDD